MILYENSIKNFTASAKSRNLSGYLAEEYDRRTSRRLSGSVKASWKYTMEVLRRLIDAANVNGDCGIRIDYVMLEKHTRFEVLLAGINDKGEQELLQIGMFAGVSIMSSDNEDFVVYSEDETKIEALHPSLQSVTYKKYITRDDRSIIINSLVYLFECEKNEELTSEKWCNSGYASEAPLFFANEEEDLVKIIEQYRGLNEGTVVLNFLHGSDRASGQSAEIFLAEIEKDILNIKFSPDQMLTIKTIQSEATDKNNTLVIIDGDPGTGKTMAAITALYGLQKEGLNVGYISSSQVQVNKLREQTRNSFGQEMFIEYADKRGSEQKSKLKDLDVLVIDEAQNLIRHSMFDRTKPELNNFFKEIFVEVPLIVIIHSSFQIIVNGSLDKDVFEDAARKADKRLIYRYLSNNVRFSGKGSGVRWLAHQLQVANTENFEDWDYDSYKIEMVQAPELLKEKLKSEIGINRILVNPTYRGGWKRDTGEFIYQLDREQFQIPLYAVKNNWLDDRDPMDLAGTVDTVLGLDFDYCGVIIGPELSYDEATGEVIVIGETDINKQTQVRNKYHVLLSRAMKGVYIYIADVKLRHFFEEKLYYSSRRFSWIKKMMEQYSEKTELEQIRNQGIEENGKDYVVNMYKAANRFIDDIKQYTENELDEEKYKEISDKCSKFLLDIQTGTLNIGNIKNRYENDIIRNMGEKAWEKLSEIGKKCLVSAEMTYRDMRDYNSLYDFSSVCLQASKAAEYELTNRFYSKYVVYLEAKLATNRNEKDFVNKVPRSMTVTEKLRKNGKEIKVKRLMEEKDVTLGAIKYIVGLNDKGTIVDKNGYLSFEGYAKGELLNNGLDTQSTLLRHIQYIQKIKDDYRNKAAHKSTMDVVTAKQCLDYVIDVQRTLAEMLDDYTF